MSYSVQGFRRDDNAAKRAGVSLRIVEKGAYRGRFLRAELVTAQTGSTGIEFHFENKQTGEFANYLTVWTHNAQGDELSGCSLVSALMVCMGLQDIHVQDGNVKEIDRESRQEVTRRAKLFGDLMNKPIGLLLVQEEYAKNDGGVGSKMVIVGCFDPVKNLMPKEILEGRSDGMLQKSIDALKDRPLKTGQQSRNSRGNSGGFGEHPASARGQSQSRQQSRPASGFDDMDDDIPF